MDESYVLIDNEKMEVRYKYPDPKVLADLMHIEYPYCEAAVISCQPSLAWQKYSDMELRMMFKKLTGQNFPGFTRHGLEPNISTLLMDLPDSTLNPAEITTQAMCVSFTDKEYYRYAPGKAQPEKVNEMFAAKALTSAPGFVPVIPPQPVASAAPTPAARAVNPIVNKLAAQTTPTPRAPRDPNAVPSAAGAPAAGSKTGRVWEICDMIWEKAGKPADTKGIRKQIIDACEAEGLSSSTASVQYGKWKSTK